MKYIISYNDGYLKVNIFKCHRVCRNPKFSVVAYGGLNTSRELPRRDFDVGTWLSAAHAARSIAGTKIRAKSHLAHGSGSVRKQSQRTIAFHYIDLGHRRCHRNARGTSVQTRNDEEEEEVGRSGGECIIATTPPSPSVSLSLSRPIGRARRFTIAPVVSVLAVDK